MTLASAALALVAMSSAFTDAPVVITNVSYGAGCVSAWFATTNEPPYLAGVFDSLDAQFLAAPHTRARPVRYRVVRERRATLRVPEGALRHRLFVQVVPASWTNEPGFREMDVAELHERHRTLKGTYVDNPPSSGDETAWTLFPTVDGCSQEVPSTPPLMSLSASGGLRLGTDWVGDVKFIVETNAVPNRIYWEGLDG